MTAEFAIALPAVILVLAVSLAALQLVGEQVRLQGAVADAARLLGRGDSGAAAVVQRVAGSARVSGAAHGDLMCATATAPGTLGLLPGITLRATACALFDPTPEIAQ